MKQEATNFEKQWEIAAEQEGLINEFGAIFMSSHPGIALVRIHDSFLFQSQEELQLFNDEFEKFKVEQRIRRKTE